MAETLMVVPCGEYWAAFSNKWAIAIDVSRFSVSIPAAIRRIAPLQEPA